MRRITIITSLIGLFFCNLAIAQNKHIVTLPEGAAIKVTLMQRLDSGDKGLEIGDKIKLQSTNDIIVGGKVLIQKYAEAEGHIIKKQHSRSLGRKGKIDFDIDWVKAIDGSRIPLRSDLHVGGKSHVAGMVAVTALVSPVGLFMRGKNAVVNKGSEFTAYVNNDTHIAIKSVNTN